MARITSSVGLITGLPIEETVKQLMAVAARPRDLLTSRTDEIKQEQTALDTLGARLLSFQFAANKLKGGSVFTTREATSSKPDLLQVALPASGTPAVGSYQVRPLQTASAQQLVSQRFDGSTTDLGSGAFSFRIGGFVDQGISLDQLNVGAGVPRGKIRITDRSGDSAVIDLTAARSVDDVLKAISTNTDISVTASTDGDAFTLSDHSGGSGNLIVQEVGAGTTASALGLAGVNVTAAEATGGDVFHLHSGTKLASLNDGNGVQISAATVADLEIGLADGTSLAIDLAGATTLGDVVTKINAVSPAKLSATIAADGNRLELTDLSGGGGSFTVANGVAGTAATDLGIEGAPGGATLAGKRVVAGLRDTLLASLNGGQGLGELGEIDITDRNGAAATVNLAAAETLGDVIRLINDSAANVTASINSARHGLVITDASGGSGNLIVANGDATDSADALGIAIDQATASVNSGALRRQTLSEATLLSSLNGGKGVVLGDITITDSAGTSKSADLNSIGSEAKTVGDVITAINALSNGVEARINDAGDGILLVDTAGGSGKLGVKDASGTIARSLNLTRANKTIDLQGTPTQVIDGTSSYSIDLSDLALSSTAIPLSTLNGGSGVAAGDIRITDSREKSLALDLNGADAGITTVGQLIDAINAKATAGGVGVTASLNAAGTGIRLEDIAGGTKKLTVTDLNSSAAADLKIIGEAKLVGGVQVIDGAGAFPAASSAQTGLAALAAKINEQNAGVTASTVFDGEGYRLSLSVNATGAANQLLVDAGGTTLEFEEAAAAQDALLLYGNLGTPSGGLLLTSSTNDFDGSIGGLDLTVSAASETPITVTVAQTDASLVEAVEDMVEAYNALRTDLDKLTAFDSEALTTGLLFGSNVALQVDTRLSHALTDRYAGLGSFQSLEQIGISVADDGMLELNKTKLRSAFETNPSGLREFVSNSQNGVAKKLSDVVERLAGSDDSLLATRSDTLQANIESNETRLESFNLQLQRQQERLLMQFYQLETLIAKLQQSQSALAALQPIAPLSV
jgi:flagellar hook-associated protein 2